jgi:hypothetical protein
MKSTVLLALALVTMRAGMKLLPLEASIAMEIVALPLAIGWSVRYAMRVSREARDDAAQQCRRFH